MANLNFAVAEPAVSGFQHLAHVKPISPYGLSAADNCAKQRPAHHDEYGGQGRS